MGKYADTPEDLEMLLEDTLVLGDRAALAGLFEEWAVLTTGTGSEVRGGRLVLERLAAGMSLHPYVADPRLVIQARRRALVLTGSGVNLVRRDRDGAWRYEILHLWTE
jgi:hypothetical protein